MSNDFQSIHEFDFDLICEYFSGLERQGPGCPESTKKALGFVEGLPKNAQIADIGCGTGGQTMVLAEHTTGDITAVDLFPSFIELFNKNARKRKLESRVKGIVGSMENLPFQEEAFDLIWSEGAIYNIGFERGLAEWRKFLKKDGYLAVSEASWFTEKRPDEINAFWNSEYPEIDTIPAKIQQMQNAGYIPVASFILPEKCWTEHYYTPQIEVQKAFLAKHSDNTAAKELVQNQQYEAHLYEMYKMYYGYVFYIGKKI